MQLACHLWAACARVRLAEYLDLYVHFFAVPLQAAAGLWTFVNEEQAWEGPYTVAELRQLVKQ